MLNTKLQIAKRRTELQKRRTSNQERDFLLTSVSIKAKRRTDFLLNQEREEEEENRSKSGIFSWTSVAVPAPRSPTSLQKLSRRPSSSLTFAAHRSQVRSKPSTPPPPPYWILDFGRGRRIEDPLFHCLLFFLSAYSLFTLNIIR